MRKSPLLWLGIAGFLFAAIPGVSWASGYYGYGSCPDPGTLQALPEVRFGMSGRNVSILQQFLNCSGYSVEITGYYGNLTTSALAAFQRDNGIIGSGKVFGARTRAAAGGRLSQNQTYGNFNGTYQDYGAYQYGQPLGYNQYSNAGWNGYPDQYYPSQGYPYFQYPQNTYDNSYGMYGGYEGMNSYYGGSNYGFQGQGGQGMGYNGPVSGASGNYSSSNPWLWY